MCTRHIVIFYRYIYLQSLASAWAAGGPTLEERVCGALIYHTHLFPVHLHHEWLGVAGGACQSKSLGPSGLMLQHAHEAGAGV